MPWHWRPDRDISHVYAESSPAVVIVRVDSTGTTGSGVVFDRRGYVLTSYHVIAEAEDDQDLVVQLLGLDEVSARIIGVDSATDLAVLQVDVSPGRLTVASFGDSDTVRVGDRAMAIGSPFGLAYSLTVGYISAVGRHLLNDDPTAPDVEQVLQTDAALNPGNSGGPLLNDRGQVIGINTRLQSPSGGSVGLGFAVPSNTAIRVARGLVMQAVQHRALAQRSAIFQEKSYRTKELSVVLSGRLRGLPQNRWLASLLVTILWWQPRSNCFSMTAKQGVTTSAKSCLGSGSQ